MATLKIGADIGNGKTSLAVEHKNKLVTLHFPSIRKKIDRHGFGDDVAVTRFHWSTEFNGQSKDNLTTYVVGDDALNKSGVMEHDRSLDRLGSEFEMFMFMVSLVRLNQKSQRILRKKDTVHMLSCVPPMYLTDDMRQRYDDLKGTYYIYIDDDPKAYEYTIVDIDLIEEGRGGMTAFAFGLNGRPNPWFEEIVKGTVKLIDLGYKTMDSFTYINGEIANASRFDMTTNMGIFPGIVRPLVNDLRSRDGDWRFVSEYAVERAIRAYGRGEHELCGVDVGESFVPIGKYIMNHATSHAQVIRSHIESDETTDGMGGVSRLIIIGGGEILLAPMFADWYPAKFIRIDKHPATCGIEDASIVLNSVGNLIFSIAQSNRMVT